MSELKLQQCRLDGRYDVLDCLGRGSYSEVYVARDVAAAAGQPRTVVIKALNTRLQGSPDAELERTLVENFRNEAVALDRVRHPNVIARLGHGTAIDLQGRTFHYLVLEYLPGGDMQALCRRGALPLEGALFYLEQVCAGLAHAHSRGVIHRDIKPQNLLLTADQHTIKIADFGVAKLEAAEGSITRVGTDVYAAPEHHPLMATGPLDTGALRPRVSQLTPAADIYSLAKTSYMLLTGESPRRFSQKPVTSLPEEASTRPWAGAVLAVLERATRTNPEKRHQSVAEFWRELKEAARAAPSPATPSPAVPPAPAGGHPKDEAKTNGHTAAPPPAPTFDRVSRTPADAARHRIVVSIAGEGGEAAVAEKRRAPAHVRGAETGRAAGADTRSDRPPHLSPRSRALIVSLVLLLGFAGMLFATYSYVSGRRAAANSTQPARPGVGPSAVGREFIATTDVRLRKGPSPGTPQVGLVEQNSRLRVLAVSGRWYEVQVIEHGRPKEHPESSDRGWLNSTFLKSP